MRSRTISVPKNKSLSFRLDSPASKIVVAQPETAQIVATTDRSFYVRGKALGPRTSWSTDQEVGFRRWSTSVSATTQRPCRTTWPPPFRARWSRVQSRRRLLLTGDVSTTAVAAEAKSLADKFAPEGVTSALTVRSASR